MSVRQLAGCLKQQLPAIREQLLNGTYKPQPMKRVEIPKPDGGVRKLGIPMLTWPLLVFLRWPRGESST